MLSLKHKQTQYSLVVWEAQLKLSKTASGDTLFPWIQLGLGYNHSLNCTIVIWSIQIKRARTLEKLQLTHQEDFEEKKGEKWLKPQADSLLFAAVLLLLQPIQIEEDSLLFAAVLLLLQPIQIEKVDPVFQIGGLRCLWLKTPAPFKEVLTRTQTTQTQT